MARLRVALTIEQCWHAVPGGTAVAALGMAGALAAGGTVELIGVSARHRRPPEPPWVPPIPWCGLPLPRIALYEAWHRLRAPSVEKATGRVDVVHATAFPMPPRSRPVVLTVHDLAWLDNPAHFTRRGLGFFRRGLELARRDADVVVCPSEATRADCVRHGLDSARVRVVPLGIDAAAATDADVVRAKARYRLERPYVLWAGTIEPRKNLPGLLQAFRMLDEGIDLVLAGPRGWNEDLESLVGDERDRVHTVGFVSPEDLRGLYAGAALLCWPSFMEGFGFPVLEAMAQGTPVVTSAGTSTEEIAGGAGVLVNPRDPQSIAAGMKEVLEDDGRAAALADAGRKRAGEFTWERTGRMLSEIYEEVAA